MFIAACKSSIPLALKIFPVVLCSIHVHLCFGLTSLLLRELHSVERKCKTKLLVKKSTKIYLVALVEKQEINEIGQGCDTTEYTSTKSGYLFCDSVEFYSCNKTYLQTDVSNSKSEGFISGHTIQQVSCNSCCD